MKAPFAESGKGCRVVLALGILALLLASCAEPPRTEADNESDGSEAVLLEGVRWRIAFEDGRTALVQAERVARKEGGSDWGLRKASLSVEAPSGEWWKASADRARLNEKLDTLQFSGGVRVEAAEKGLSARELTVNMKSGTLQAEGDVVLESEGWRIEALRASGDIGHGRWTLARPRARFAKH